MMRVLSFCKISQTISRNKVKKTILYKRRQKCVFNVLDVKDCPLGITEIISSGFLPASRT